MQDAGKVVGLYFLIFGHQQGYYGQPNGIKLYD